MQEEKRWKKINSEKQTRLKFYKIKMEPSYFLDDWIPHKILHLSVYSEIINDISTY